MNGTGHMNQGIWKQYLNGRSDYFEKNKGYIIPTEWPQGRPGEIKSFSR
jgi:hypothetical protein